jgi:hypothetical protein
MNMCPASLKGSEMTRYKRRSKLDRKSRAPHT